MPQLAEYGTCVVPSSESGCSRAEGSADSLAAFSSALLVGTAIENYNEKKSGIGNENYPRICD
jgi:hypothetical protein